VLYIGLALGLILISKVKALLKLQLRLTRTAPSFSHPIPTLKPK